MAATAVATPRVKTSGPQVSGILDYLSTVDHKKIGIMYLYATFTFFLIGGILALLVRLQLASPANTFLTPTVYNQVFTMHGTTMIFLFVIPMWSGFGNYIVPLQIGARDMAFPRIKTSGPQVSGILDYLSSVDHKKIGLM